MGICPSFSDPLLQLTKKEHAIPLVECSSCSTEIFNVTAFKDGLQIFFESNLRKCTESKKVPSLEVEQLEKFRGTTATL